MVGVIDEMIEFFIFKIGEKNEYDNYVGVFGIIVGWIWGCLIMVRVVSQNKLMMLGQN